MNVTITTAGNLNGAAGRKQAPLRLPIPFLLTGSCGAALFGLLLPWIAPDALLAPDFPHVLALVHVATLGWLTMTMLGASMQLAPVILVAPLRAARFAYWQYPIYVSGVVLLISGFWQSWPWLLIAGGSLIVLAIAHHVVMLSATIWSSAARPLTVRFLVASLIYLSLVVSLGLTAALNFQFGFLGNAADRLLRVHIILGVVGWLTCTLLGVSYTLVRMFALAHAHDDHYGRLVFLLLNGGVVGLAVAFSFAWFPLIIVGGGLLVAAVWLFAYDYLRMLRVRRRKPLDVTQRHGIAAVVYLALAMPFGVLGVTLGWDQEPQLVAIALAMLIGWLGQSIVGYLYKIVPFLIWQARYAPLAGKRPIPLMRDLVHERWAEASWWLINIGVAAAIVCALGVWSIPLRIASIALGAGLVLAAANIVGVVAPRHVAPISSDRKQAGRQANANAIQ
ncbi:MAG: hypothetical protein ABI068_02540 [Ktedonobacterales bacterium]